MMTTTALDVERHLRRELFGAADGTTTSTTTKRTRCRSKSQTKASICSHFLSSSSSSSFLGRQRRQPLSSCFSCRLCVVICCSLVANFFNCQLSTLRQPLKVEYRPGKSPYLFPHFFFCLLTQSEQRIERYERKN